MNLIKVLKSLTIIMAAAFLIGIPVFFFSLGLRNAAKDEFKETAVKMQESVNDNEMDATTGTLNYDTYKVALNHAVNELADGEQLIHINIGFGSLDRGLKYINDTYGHLNGRPAIQDFAEILKEVFPEDEGWTIAHRGGSSFLVFGKGQFDEDIILKYYESMRAKWHDTPYHVADGSGTVEGMALFFCASVGPECGTSFKQLRDVLVYKKLALRDITNCGYVIVTSPDRYICSEDIDETAYMEK